MTSQSGKLHTNSIKHWEQTLKTDDFQILYLVMILNILVIIVSISYFVVSSDHVFKSYLQVTQLFPHSFVVYTTRETKSLQQFQNFIRRSQVDFQTSASVLTMLSDQPSHESDECGINFNMSPSTFSNQWKHASGEYLTVHLNNFESQMLSCIQVFHDTIAHVLVTSTFMTSSILTELYFSTRKLFLIENSTGKYQATFVSGSPPSLHSIHIDALHKHELLKNITGDIKQRRYCLNIFLNDHYRDAPSIQRENLDDLVLGLRIAQLNNRPDDLIVRGTPSIIITQYLLQTMNLTLSCNNQGYTALTKMPEVKINYKMLNKTGTPFDHLGRYSIRFIAPKQKQGQIGLFNLFRVLISPYGPTLFLLITFASINLCWVAYILSKCGRQRILQYQNSRRVTSGEILGLIFRPLVEQCRDIRSLTAPIYTRIIIEMWLLSCLILVTIYRTKLVIMSTIGGPSTWVETFDQLSGVHESDGSLICQSSGWYYKEVSAILDYDCANTLSHSKISRCSVANWLTTSRTLLMNITVEAFLTNFFMGKVYIIDINLIVDNIFAAMVMKYRYRNPFRRSNDEIVAMRFWDIYRHPVDLNIIEKLTMMRDTGVIMYVSKIYQYFISFLLQKHTTQFLAEGVKAYEQTMGRKLQLKTEMYHNEPKPLNVGDVHYILVVTISCWFLTIIFLGVEVGWKCLHGLTNRVIVLSKVKHKVLGKFM